MTARHRTRATNRGPARLRQERGAVIPFLVVLLPALVALAGLAYDAGMLFAARREAANVAAAAARAGANQIEPASLYDNDPVLSADAGPAAASFARASGFSTVGIRYLSDTEIEVTVARTVDMVLLDVIGIDSKQVTGVAIVEIEAGGS